MSDSRRILGAEGELRAAVYLRKKGYRITAQNVRAGGVEIDIIAERGNRVVFVEVKSRRSVRFGSPESAVDARKQARLVRGAFAWLRENPRRRARIRFDVISCQVQAPRDTSPEIWRIRHLDGAFDASVS